MHLGQRLKQERKAQNLTQEGLAVMAGLPPESGRKTIQVLEQRDSKRSEYAPAFAKALGLRLEYLLNGEEPKYERDNASTRTGGAQPEVVLLPVSVWDDSTPLDDDEVEVPFYKEVEFAAGSGATHGLEINGRRVRYGKSSLRAAGVDPENAACGKATGNSMEPLIQDGSLVGIDRSKTDIVDGEIYALDHDGMLRVKYVYKVGRTGIRLRSFNVDEHPDETYSGEDAQKIKILGWVWTWSPPIRKWRGK